MSETEKKRKILIVDDNKQNIEILMDLFKDKYRVAAALNGERALKIAASESPPDIILLDIVMPEMNGYRVCRLLKGGESTMNIPVIFVTAVSEVMDATRGFETGAVDYITKPFHPPMVEARVKLHLDLKHKQELLEEYAFIDSLTEMPNRRSFDQQAEKEWKRAQRSGQPLSVLSLDIDHFKEYNDTYGHGQGDECLRRVAQSILRCLRRAGDFAARFGGDEFAALLPYTKREEGLTIAAAILQDLADQAIPHAESRAADHVTVSCGLTTAATNSGATIDQILQAADRALYAAKHGGRNTVAEAKL